MMMNTLVTLLIVAHSSFAKTTLEQVQDLGTAKLEGSPMVYYSTNAQMSDAVFTQGLVAEAVEFYRSHPEVMVTLEIYPAILNKNDWVTIPIAALYPYGIPNLSDDKPYVAFIGATDDNALTAYILQMEPMLPQQNVDAIGRTGFTYAQAAHLFPFMVAIHEMGHAYARELGIGYPLNYARAIDEMLANYILYAFLKEHRPALADIWDALSDGYVVTQCPKFTSVEDFDTRYDDIPTLGGPENYFWYQGMIHHLSRELYKSEGLNFLKKMKEVVAAGDRQKAYAKLVELHPYARSWLDSFHCVQTPCGVRLACANNHAAL